ncbi:MAG: hypothetical protein CFH34_01539 [Alphaproteobacteria bacterium MarineAlpha9_Bin4]|nr:MAG: hypothetical protein CFH34_01539 [Alphaproteobacteria bacterium MarineAlpha9_Bin4]|tara:strand:+ start:3205 stop:3699 length:495 start_codon:yes stop_codon:yes gene_type:complete
MIKKNKPEYQDDYIKSILFNTKTIAMVGLSDDEKRPSNFAAKYLQTKGYKIIPVNPITKKKIILKEKVYSSLADLEFVPDMVDIFIKSEKVLNIVNAALKIRPKTIWLQLGVVSKSAEEKVQKANINFVMDRCPKIEYARLAGELGWGGINTGIITSKKIKLIR